MRARFSGARPANERLSLPSGTKYVAEDPSRRARLCHETYRGPAEYARPTLPKLGRPVADLVVCQRCIDPAKGGAYLQTADVRTLMFQPHPWRNETVFTRWADAAASAGVRDLIMGPVLNVRETYDPKWEEGGYRFYHLQWDRNYWWGYPPEPIRHGLTVMFHTGARYIMNEIDIFDQKAGRLTGWGPMWFDFLRYAKLHPPRGEGQARIAVMRGLGDEWNRLAVLSGYDVVLYFGRGDGTTPEEIAALESYVAQGGRLVIAAGQLRGLDDRIPVDRFCGVPLAGDARLPDGTIYSKLGPAESATLLSQLESGHPAALSVPFGEGRGWLFSGEWVTYWNDAVAARTCGDALAGAEWLTFGPVCEWLEYHVRRKAGCWVLPIFNHGRGFYPSGNGPDHGVWTGRVVVDLAKLELTSFR